MTGNSSQSDDLKLQVAELRAKLNLMLAMKSDDDFRRKHLENELALLRSSTTWRATSPLRTFVAWIGKRFS